MKMKFYKVLVFVRSPSGEQPGWMMKHRLAGDNFTNSLQFPTWEDADKAIQSHQRKYKRDKYFETKQIELVYEILAFETELKTAVSPESKEYIKDSMIYPHSDCGRKTAFQVIE